MTDRRQVLQVAVLAAAGVLVLPACSTDDPAPDVSATPDPQQADELALIAAYDAALLSAGPKQTAVFQALRDEHAAHARALGWTDIPAPTTSQESVGRAALLRAERAAARQRADGARDAGDTELAQVLALIAASEAQHVVTLEAL